MCKEFLNWCLAVGVLASLACSTAVGQQKISYVQYCQNRLKASEVESVDQFLASLKLTDALRVSNLLHAEKNAHQTLKFAKKLKLPGAVETAKLDLELIHYLSHGYGYEDRNFDRYSLKIPESARPEFKVHFYLALIDWEVKTENFQVDFAAVVKASREAIKQSGDLELKFEHLSYETYIAMFLLSIKPSLTELDDKLKELSFLARALPWVQEASVGCLIEGRMVKDNIVQKAAFWKKALQLAITQDNLSLAIRIQLLLGRAAFLDSSDDVRKEAIGHCIKTIELAKQLNCEQSRLVALNQLAFYHREFGNRKEAVKCLEEAINSVAFQYLPIRKQQSFYKCFRRANLALGARSKAIEISEDIVSPKVLRKLDVEARKHQQLATTFDQKQKEAYQQQQEIVAGHLLATSKIEQEKSFFKWYAAIATLTTLLSLSVLGVALMRGRLKKAHQELHEEREVSRESQQKYDDLALRLNRVQRMESLGLMAGSVAHDFNNILVGVMGNTELMIRKGAGHDDPFIQDRLTGIMRSAEKAADLSRQMLAYAGRESIAKQNAELNDLILQYLPVLNSTCEQGQKITLDLIPESIVAKVDVTQIEQVLLNLVTNSVAVSDQNGTIKISTGLETIDDVESDFSLYGIREDGGEFCYLEVSDQGDGISKEDLQRIFEPFYTNTRAGRGLGLSVVYGVVKGHDGLVRCRSTVGEGTSFRILLPVIQQQNSDDPIADPATTKLRPHHRPKPKSEQKVLVVDDEATVLDLCRHFIQLSGCQVITGHGGRPGIELALSHADKISCILLDVVMPEMGASEFLSELEAASVDVPVVLMSGFSQTRLEFFLERPNVVSIIQKPFYESEIRKAVDEAINAPSKTQEAIG